jgi:hypothetical protein
MCLYIPSNLDQAAALLIRTRGVFGSNLCRRPTVLTGFTWFSSFPPGKCRDNFLNCATILTFSLLPSPLLTIIQSLDAIYSETSIYRSRIIRFPGSVVQFLWSLSESYFNYGSRICCFPGSIVSFSDPRRKR